MEISCEGSWTPAVQALSAAGLRASHALRHRCAKIHLYDPGLRAELIDSMVRPVLLHGSEIRGATAQIGLTSFGRQGNDATEQVHCSCFRSLLGVRASTPGVSILGEFGRFPLFVDRVRAISSFLNRLVGLRGSGSLVSIAFEDSVRLWEEVEFMQHATALPKSCAPLTMVRGWFGDAVQIFGRQYSPMGPFDQLPECDTAAMVAHMQRLYLTGPPAHRQGPVKATYDSLRDGASYSCAAYIRSQYFTEAYRTLTGFRTGSHDLAGTTGLWVARESFSSYEHRLCTQCHLHRIEDEVHFIFEYPTV
jgi:hypothetical protein